MQTLIAQKVLREYDTLEQRSQELVRERAALMVTPAFSKIVKVVRAMRLSELHETLEAQVIYQSSPTAWVRTPDGRLCERRSCHETRQHDGRHGRSRSSL